QRVGHQIDLPDRQVVVRAPPRVHRGDLLIAGPSQALHLVGSGRGRAWVDAGHERSPSTRKLPVDSDAMPGTPAGDRPTRVSRPPCRRPAPGPGPAPGPRTPASR